MRNFLKSTAFLAFIACLLWSTAFAGIKIGLQYITPLQFAGLRFAISGILLFIVFAKPKTYFQYLKSNLGFILWIAFLQTVLMYSLFYTGINMVPGALGAMVVGSGPLFAAIVAHFAFNNDKLNRKTLFALLTGILGIVVINLGRQTSGIGDVTEIIGVLILIVNNMVSGLYNVAVMKSKREIPSMILSSASLGLGGLILFAISIPIEGWNLNTHFPTEFYLSLGWLSFLSAAAFAIWFVLLKRPGVKISYLNSWKFVVPVFGAILSWLLIAGESPDIYALIGMLIVGTAMLIMNNDFIKRLFSKHNN